MASVHALAVALFNASIGGYKSDMEQNTSAYFAAAGAVLEKDLTTNAAFVDHLLGNLGVATSSVVYLDARAALLGMVAAQGRESATKEAINFLSAQTSGSLYFGIATAFATKVAKAEAFTRANANERDVSKLISGVTNVDTDEVAIQNAANAARIQAEATAAQAAVIAKAQADAALAAVNNTGFASEQAAFDAARAAGDAALKTAQDAAATAAANAKAQADAALAAVNNTTFASEQDAFNAAKAAGDAAVKAAQDAAAQAATIAKLQADAALRDAQVAAQQQLRDVQTQAQLDAIKAASDLNAAQVALKAAQDAAAIAKTQADAALAAVNNTEYTSEQAAFNAAQTIGQQAVRDAQALAQQQLRDVQTQAQLDAIKAQQDLTNAQNALKAAQDAAAIAKTQADAALKAAQDAAALAKTQADSALAAVNNTGFASEQAAFDAAKAIGDQALSQAQQQINALQAQLNTLTVAQNVTLTSSAPSVTEGDAGTKNLTFVLRLDKAYAAPVVVNYFTNDGTATAGDDYETAAGAVTFAAGQTSAIVNVVVKGDTAIEGNETIRVEFSGAALINTVTATGTITNDDQAQQEQNAFTITSAQIALANANNVPVTLDVGGEGSKTVTVQSDGASATRGIIINGNANTTINSGASADSITLSGNGNNTISTGGGNDTVTVFGSGNNTINVGTGSDTVVGGTGSDTIVFASGALGAGDVVTGGAGQTTIRISGDGNVVGAGGATLTGVENIVLDGTTLTISAAALQALVTAGLKSITASKLTSDLIISDFANNQILNLSSIEFKGGFKTINTSGANNNYNIVLTTEQALAVQALAALSGTLTQQVVVQGAQTVAEGVALIASGVTASFELKDTAANLALAPTAVFNKAVSIEATTVATAAQAAAIAATDSAATSFTATTTNLKYSVSDTASMLANYATGLGNATTVTATTDATVAEAAAIHAAAAGGVVVTTATYAVKDTVAALSPTTVTVTTTNASSAASVATTVGFYVGMPITGANIPAGTTVTAINVNGTAFTLSANATATGADATGAVFINGASLNAATSVTINNTVTDVNVVSAINAALNTAAGGLTKVVNGYNVSDGLADITGANVAVSNAAGNITVTDANITSANANAIEALTNTGTNSYVLEDGIANVLGTPTAVVTATSAASTSTARITVDQAVALVAKYGVSKVTDANLIVEDSAANLLRLPTNVLAEANAVELTGTASVADALKLRTDIGAKLTLTTVNVSDSATAIKAAVAVPAQLVLIDKFNSVAISGNTSLADVDTINQALAGETTVTAGLTAVATGYLLVDSAANLIATTTTREAGIVGASSKVTVTGAATLANIATIITSKTGNPVLGTDIVYSLSDNAANLTAGAGVAARVAGATTIAVTDASVSYANAASLTALTKFNGVYSISDTVANLVDKVSDAQKLVLNGAVSVTLKDSAANLRGADGITTRALNTTDLVTLEDALGTLTTTGAINTTNVPAAVLADVDAFVLTNTTGAVPLVLTAADVGTGLKALLDTARPVTYTVYDSATNLKSASLTAAQKAALLGAAKVYVDADGNGTLDAAISVADFNTIDTATNGSIFANLEGTIATLSASNAATAISTRLANTNTVAVTDYASATATAAQANTLAARGVPLSNGGNHIDVVDTAASISSLSDAVWTALIANANATVTASDNGTLTLNVARAAEVYDNTGAASGSKYGNFNLVDTAAALVAANDNLVQTALSVTANTQATIAEANALGAQKVAGFGSVVYSVTASAADLADVTTGNLGNSVGTNNAQNLTANTAATLVQAVSISALTNSGTKTYNLTDSAANIATDLASNTPATVTAALRAINGAVTVDATLTAATATGAQATTLAAAAKAIKYNISDTADALAVNTVTVAAFNEANNIVVTAASGVTSATLATTILGATNAGTTTIAAVTATAAQAKALVLGANDTITALTVTGTTSATDAKAIAALDTGANIGTLTFNKIEGTAEELISAGTAVLALASAVNGTTAGVFATTDLTVAQKNTLGAHVDSYNLKDSFANLMVNGDVTGDVDADAAVTAATKVTVTDTALTVAQVASLNSVHNVAKYVYNIVDNDANIRAAIDTSATTRSYLSSATTVTANAGQSLKFASVGAAPAFGITGTKAELSALSSVLKNGNLIYTATVADLNADLQFYSSLPSGSVVSVSGTFAQLTSGNAAVGTASKITVDGLITKAQADTVLALSAVDSTVYSIEDSAANLTAGNGINGAVNVTATGQATAAQAEVIVDATNTGSHTVNITDTDAAIAAAILATGDAFGANAANNITVTGTTGLSHTDAAAVLTAAKGNATISKVTGSAVQILGLTLAAGDSIGNASSNAAITVDQFAKLKAMAATVTYSLSDTAANLALADVSVMNGAINITVNETANAGSIALAVKIDAATNSGTNTFSIADTAANVLGATAVQLQLDPTILITDTFVSADTATALRAKDVASDTQTVNVTIGQGAQAVGAFVIRDSVENLTNTANAAAVTNGHTVTVTDPIVTIAQGTSVLGVNAAAVFNITDTYNNINNNFLAGATGSAGRAVDLTVTGNITVSQANNIVNTVGAANNDTVGKEIFSIQDTANNVAVNAGLNNATKVVDDAQSIVVTGATTVARAGFLSELKNLSNKYSISDTAVAVSAALNAYNGENLADRATVLAAGSITLTTDPTVAMAAGTSVAGAELLGLYKVSGLKYTVTDTGAAMVAGLASPDALALTEATALYLDGATALTVKQAESLTAQANFKGFDANRTDSTPGIYNVGDASAAVLNASYDLLAKASIVTVAAEGNVDLSAIDRALIINGSGSADTIVGTNYADTITGGVGADVLSGGDGADTFVFAVLNTFGTDGTAVADVISDFIAGTDKLQFSAITDVVSVEQNAVQAAVTALNGATDAQIATAMANANATNLGVSFAVYGGNTYVYVETVGATTTHDADANIFIKLTGVTTLPTFAADVIA